MDFQSAHVLSTFPSLTPVVLEPVLWAPLTGQETTKIPDGSLKQRHLSVVEADTEVDGWNKVQDLVDNLCVALDQCCAERIYGAGTPAIAACRLANWGLRSFLICLY